MKIFAPKLMVGFLAVMVLFTACKNESGAEKSITDNLGGGTTRTLVESNEPQFAPLAEGAPIATIETNYGVIKIALFPKEAPLAVENFKGLAEKGFYNETEFHRVEKDFVIQAGDPTGTGKGGESIWGQPFKSEYSDRMHHFSGAVCMATGDDTPDTNLSQFYIVVSPQGNITEELVVKMQGAGLRPEVIETYKQAGGEPYLDNKATVFGQVYEGMEIADKIANVTVTEENQPKKPVKIVSITTGVYSAVPASESGQSAEQASSKAE